LPPGEALIRRFAEPLHGLGIVLRDALAILIRGAEVVLPPGEALIRRFAGPLHGLGIVLRDALAVRIHVAEIRLRVG
jgi:hypothetical protein